MNAAGRRRLLGIAAAIATGVIVGGCVETGEPAQIGCLVDMKEPGCPGAANDAGTSSSDGSPTASRDGAPDAIPADAETGAAE